MYKSIVLIRLDDAFICLWDLVNVLKSLALGESKAYTCIHTNDELLI